MGFCALYARTAYQFAESALSPSAYAKKAKELGYDAIGIADKASLFACPEFFDACHKEGIRPVLGMETKLLHPTGTKAGVLYVLNETGYANLCALLASKKDGFYPKDFQGLSDGLALVIPFHSLNRSDMRADQSFLKDFSSLFHWFFLGIAIEKASDRKEADAVRAFGASHSYPTIAFPFIDYLDKKDKFIEDILSADRLKTPLTREQMAEKETGGPNFLLSPKIMAELYPQEELSRAFELASQANFDLFGKKRGSLLSFCHDPKADVELFETKTREGMAQRGLAGKPDYESRLAYETKVIVQMGFASYFLLVSDYVVFAKDNGIKVGPGRGSACGSLVSYLLKITEVDPLAYDLSFERFLNPKRVTMPDIDIDFEDDRRDEIPAYLKRKYGEDKVSQIVTFSTFKPKSAIKTAGLAIGMTEAKLQGLLSTIRNDSPTIAQALAASGRFQWMSKDPYYQQAVALARTIEGLPNNTSIHAPGVILSDQPIAKQVPLSDGTTGIAGYQYPVMERLGFLKVDLLSLHYLTLVKAMEQALVANGHPIPDYQTLRDDPETYQTLVRGDLLKIFQLESKGFKAAIQEVKPSCFNDLVALLALYRPGPKDKIPDYARGKATGKVPSSGYPALDRILKDTYGIIIYQEQILKIAHEIAGLDMGEADLLRRAISKKDSLKMASYEKAFVAGCMANHMAEADAKAIYGWILKFASYGFNKSHSVAYSLITFSMAYLKTHFPKEYYGTVINEIPPSTSEFKSLLTELAHFRIVLKPVDLNHSQLKTTIQGNLAYLGFKTSAAVSDSLSQEILQAREKGPFTGLADFLLRVKVDKRTIVGLAQAGLFDGWGFSRKTIQDQSGVLADFSTLGMDPSMFPVFPQSPESELDRVKAFFQERNANRVALRCTLESIHPVKLPKGYRIGAVNGTPFGNRVVLDNDLASLSFDVPVGLSLKPYDIVVFRPVPTGSYPRYYRIEDATVYSPKE